MMKQGMLRVIATTLFVLIISACSDTSNPTNAGVEQTSGEISCPSLVQSAVQAVDDNCQSTTRNQVCYGNVSLQAETLNDENLSTPGDIVDLANIQRLQLSPMDVSQNIWGVAMLKLQANLSDTNPGQAVTFLIFGDVKLENQNANENGIQSFYFNSGIGDAQCKEAPDSGILVQTPQGITNVTLSLNNVEISLGSTAYLQAQPDAQMTVNVLEGQAVVTSQGATQTVSAGNRTQVELDGEGLAMSTPTVPEPYDTTAVDALPVESLDEEIVIASTLYSAKFTDSVEDWGIFQDGTDIEHVPADESSDGSICATDLGQGVYWYFDAPEEWLGERTDLYNGYITYTIRQLDTAGTESGYPDVMLVGDELTLQYEFGIKPFLTWTSYRALLNEQGGWTTDGSTPPTQEEFMKVLENLTAVRIRGEYVSGVDSACLDHVQFVKGGFSASDTDFIATTTGLISFPQAMQDWRIYQDGSNLEYVPADEESKGAICATDLGGGVYWYFELPQGWLGDRSDLYNGTLNYRMRQRDTAGEVTGQPDLMLVSDEITLIYEFENKPLLTWTPFSIVLNENAGWTMIEGETPTAGDFQSILRNLTAVRIRGEYVNGADSACIDEVHLLPA